VEVYFVENKFAVTSVTLNISLSA
jgi:hypothetical protein